MRFYLGIALVFAAVVAAAAIWRRSREEDPARPPPPTVVEFAMARTRFRDLEVAAPEEWMKDASPLVSGILFRGPKDAGFMPNVMYYWWQAKRNPEEFFEERRLSLRGGLRPPEQIVESEARVAGMRAVRFLYTFYEPEGAYRAVDYVFAGDRGCGLLRGTCAVRTADRYQPLFDRLAAEVRLLE